jgi:putative oxidoreductase
MPETIQTQRSTAGTSTLVRGASAGGGPARLRGLLLSGATTDSRAADLGLLILRVFAGLALALAHGLGKVPPSDRFIVGVAEMGLPFPGLFAVLAATAEFGGGLLLALGLLTRPAAFLVAGNMLIVSVLAHAGDPFGVREKPILFGAVALLFLLAGAGRYSLDAMLRSSVVGRRSSVGR